MSEDLKATIADGNHPAWEYCGLAYPNTEGLNKYGAIGWELVSVVATDMDLSRSVQVAYFKRQLFPAAQPNVYTADDIAKADARSAEICAGIPIE